MVAEGAAGGAPGSLIERHFAPPTDPLISLAPFRSTESRTPVVDAPVVEEPIRAAAPRPTASGPPKVKMVGERRSQREAAEGEEPPAKRPALVVSKVRLAQEVQEVEPESYDARDRSPLRSSGLVRPTAVPPSSAPAEGAAQGAPFVFGAPVEDQAPITPRRSAPSEGAGFGEPEEGEALCVSLPSQDQKDLPPRQRWDILSRSRRPTHHRRLLLRRMKKARWLRKTPVFKPPPVLLQGANAAFVQGR